MEKQKNRENKIVKVSLLGIITNFVLAAFKIIIGTISNSIAIRTDGINNFGDSLSSVITLIGTKLAMKEPDRKHPYGYGRVENISSLIITLVILYTGITALIDSIKMIFTGEIPEYTNLALVIVVVATVVKLLLGLYTKNSGKKYESDALIASGKDSLHDCLMSIATLVAAILFITTKVSIEAYISAGIAVLIIKSDLDLMKDIVGQIIGTAVPAKLSRAVKQSISAFPEVEGAYDLIIHNYGKEILIGSVHVEVRENLTAAILDTLERDMTKKVLEDTGVVLTGISIYAINQMDADTNEVREKILKFISEEKYILQMHGFYKDKIDQKIKFDIVVDYDAKNKQAIREALRQKVIEFCPGYEVDITLDYDFSEEPD